MNCARCNKRQAAEGKTKCEICLAKERAYYKKWYQRNKAKKAKGGETPKNYYIRYLTKRKRSRILKHKPITFLVAGITIEIREKQHEHELKQIAKLRQQLKTLEARINAD